jgi:hypothetical protein
MKRAIFIILLLSSPIAFADDPIPLSCPQTLFCDTDFGQSMHCYAGQTVGVFTISRFVADGYSPYYYGYPEGSYSFITAEAQGDPKSGYAPGVVVCKYARNETNPPERNYELDLVSPPGYYAYVDSNPTHWSIYDNVANCQKYALTTMCKIIQKTIP